MDACYDDELRMSENKFLDNEYMDLMEDPDELDQWAHQYDDLNGAPESEDDR